MYKFEIHRNPYNPITDSYTDTVRYESSDYVLEREISPKWSDLSFVWEKDDGRYFFRKKLNGSFTLLDSDFNWVKDIMDSEEKELYRILIIKERVDGVWTEVWRGFFSVITGRWNLTNCSVSFDGLLVWDEYNVILENLEKEKNLLDVSPALLTLYYSANEYTYEEKIQTSSEVITPDGCWNENDGFKSPSSSEKFPGDDWTLVKKNVIFRRVIGGFDPEDPNQWNDSYEFAYTYTYRRDYIIQVNNPGGWTDLGSYPSGSGNEQHKYTQNYRGLISLSFEQEAYNPFTYRWMDSLGAIIDCDSYRNRDYNLIISQSDFDETTDRGRYFKDVVYDILIGYGVMDAPQLTSMFFDDFTNPITGETNELRFLQVFQITDLMDTSDPATKALYSFADIEGWIGMFQCGWYINDNGKIQFEHKKFFDNGLSYSGVEYEMDISDKNTVIDVSYKNTGLPRIEKFSVRNVGTDDFWGVPMVYSSSMANWEDGNVVDYDFGIYTDMSYVIEKQKDAGKDGFLMVAVELDGGTFRVYAEDGKITGIPILNEPMSAAGLQYRYWRWGRPVNRGFMNNKSTDFDSVQNNIISENIIVGYCGEFNPYKLVRTNYGDGKVEKAEMALVDKKMTLALTY